MALADSVVAERSGGGIPRVLGALKEIKVGAFGQHGEGVGALNVDVRFGVVFQAEADVHKL